MPAALLFCASCAITTPPESGARLGGITVRAYWDARTAARTAKLLAEPLERELAKIDGVSRIITRCDADGCSILLQHDASVPGYEVGFAAGAALKRIEDKLPTGARAEALSFNITRPPDIAVALILDAKQVTAKHYSVASSFAMKVMQLPNVERHEIPGRPARTIQVELDPTHAARLGGKLGISVADVAKAIEKQTIRLDEHTRIVVGRQAGRKGDVRDIVLKRVGPGGRTLIRVRDVARVREVVTPVVCYRVNSEPAILLNIFLRSAAPPEEVRTCLERVLALGRPAAIKRVVPIRITLDY